MYKRDNEKDYVVIVNRAVRGQNQLFEKVIIDSQSLAVHFEGRVIPQRSIVNTLSEFFWHLKASPEQESWFTA